MNKKRKQKIIIKTIDVVDEPNQNNSNKILNAFDEKIQKSQMLYQLASIDWAKIINESIHFKGIAMHTFVPEIVKGIKNHFIEKLEEIFNQNKPLDKNLSNEDYSILKLLTTQIKNKNSLKTVEIVDKEEEPIQETVQKTSIEELKKMSPVERAAVVKAELKQKEIQKENRMTVMNNPHRKPPMNEFERQARALSEASIVMNSAVNNGINPQFNPQASPSIDNGGQSISHDPNVM